MRTLFLLSIFLCYKTFYSSVNNAIDHGKFKLPDLNLPGTEDFETQEKIKELHSLSGANPESPQSKVQGDGPSPVLSTIESRTSLPVFEKPRVVENKQTTEFLKVSKRRGPESVILDNVYSSLFMIRKLERSMTQEAIQARLNFPRQTWASLRKFFLAWDINMDSITTALSSDDILSDALLERHDGTLPSAIHHVLSRLSVVSQDKSTWRDLSGVEPVWSLEVVPKHSDSPRAELERETINKRQRRVEDEDAKTYQIIQQEHPSPRFYFSRLGEAFSIVTLDYWTLAKPVSSKPATDLRSIAPVEKIKVKAVRKEPEENAELLVGFLCGEMFSFRRLLYQWTLKSTTDFQKTLELRKKIQPSRVLQKYGKQPCNRRDRWVWFYASELGKEEIRRMPDEKRQSIDLLTMKMHEWVTNQQARTRSSDSNQEGGKKKGSAVKAKKEVFIPPPSWAEDALPTFIYISLLLDKYLKIAPSTFNPGPAARIYEGSWGMVQRAFTKISAMPTPPNLGEFMDCFEVQTTASRQLLQGIFDKMSRVADKLVTMSVLFSLFEIWARESGHPLVSALRTAPSLAVGRIDTGLKGFISQAVIFDAAKKFLFGA